MVTGAGWLTERRFGDGAFEPACRMQSVRKLDLNPGLPKHAGISPLVEWRPRAELSCRK